MKIIQIESSVSGARPPLQDWSWATPPEGYAICPAEFEATFYSTSPAGFVDITIDGDTVTGMEVNQAALDAYIASLPEPEDPQPTAEEDRDAMLVDLEYRMTLLELGV